jgi:type VI secretion system protein ImpL
LNLQWPRGDGPVAMNAPSPQCSYWLPEKAVFIEPGLTVLGPSRQQNALMELSQELREKRVREPIDGMVLVINAQRLADSDDEAVDVYGKALRRYMVEVGQALDADVPVYVIVTALDALWGFGDAFQWTAERRTEEPWGFSLPPTTDAAHLTPRVLEELEGVLARIESTCFAKLASEDHPDARGRAYQYLADVRDVLAKLGDLMKIITVNNAFERSPWVRALVVGSGMPGTGHKLRHRALAFGSMGYYPPQHSGTPQPGGMPIHALLDNVLLPERDLVPTVTRWRDDKLTLALWILGVVGWIAIVVLSIVRTLAK